MKIVTLSDKDVPNYFRKFFENMSIRLDGQTLDLRLSYGDDYSYGGIYWILFSIVKTRIQDLIQQHDPTQDNNIKFQEIQDPANPKDFIMHIDFSNYDGPGGGFGGMIQQEPNLGDIYFHDWHSKKITDIRWLYGGLRIRIEFENKSYPDAIVSYNPSPGINIEANVKNFHIDLYLVPYVFWDLSIPWPPTDNPIHYDHTLFLPRITGKNLYKRRCSLIVYLDYEFIHVFGLAGDLTPYDDLDRELKYQLKRVAGRIGSSMNETELFGGIQMLFFGLIQDHIMGVDIQPNKARFLFFDSLEYTESFTGEGKIVAVRKERLQSHLYPKSYGKLEGTPYKYKPNNIIEVEIEDKSGKHHRITTLNLIESILEGRAHIQGVHHVFRHQKWGEVVSYLGASDSCILYKKELAYCGYLRSNHNADKKDNLNNLPTYGYDKEDPLFKNIYDGTIFFVKTGYYPSFKRILYHRNWKRPTYYDHSTYPMDNHIPMM